MNELEQTAKDIAAWEKLADGFREEAIAAEALAQDKWNQVELLEARIASDTVKLLEMES